MSKLLIGSEVGSLCEEVSRLLIGSEVASFCEEVSKLLIGSEVVSFCEEVSKLLIGSEVASSCEEVCKLLIGSEVVLPCEEEVSRLLIGSEAASSCEEFISLLCVTIIRLLRGFGMGDAFLASSGTEEEAEFSLPFFDDESTVAGACALTTTDFPRGFGTGRRLDRDTEVTSPPDFANKSFSLSMTVPRSGLESLSASALSFFSLMTTWASGGFNLTVLLDRGGGCSGFLMLSTARDEVCNSSDAEEGLITLSVSEETEDAGHI